ncbi:MAG: glycosyltransferase family 2 protein [bacterium]
MSEKETLITSRIRVGEMLCREGHLTEAQLNQALKVQQRTGEKIGRVLIDLGFVSRLALVQTLAGQLDLTFFDLLQNPPTPEIVMMLKEEAARRLEAIPVARRDQEIVVAFVDPQDQKAREEVERQLGVPVAVAITSDYDVRWTLQRVYRKTYSERAVTDLYSRRPEESAAEMITTPQLAVLFVVLFLLCLGLVTNAIATFIIVNVVATTIYLSVSFYRLFLMYRGATHRITISPSYAELTGLRDKDLPRYTILIPLFREKNVLPGLFKAIGGLDYPHTKLDVKLLFEETDRGTYEAAIALKPPPHFQLIVVPDSSPRTKPKACNYGLIHASGEFVGVYDAEDIPEADQLKKAVVAFRRESKQIVCLQARLNYYNRHQNILTRWFTTEYSMWFDLLLPGLDASRAPIPLGGTSNHFVTERLRELGGWDPFNVTEDADLGIRLHKAGYRTAVIDSTTYEEAVSSVVVWIAQRSRWVKGYMQTWLVHMRNPVALWRAVGPRAFFSFQMMIGATPVTFLLNPVYWVLTLLWLLYRWDVIPMVFPPFVYYLAAICLLLGNFVFMYVNVAGSMRRGYHELVRYAIISPIYWGLMSVAAWRSLHQLIVNPHYWDKTTHGLYAKRPNAGGPTSDA